MPTGNKRRPRKLSVEARLRQIEDGVAAVELLVTRIIVELMRIDPSVLDPIVKSFSRSAEFGVNARVLRNISSLLVSSEMGAVSRGVESLRSVSLELSKYKGR
jgi:hypothetical protein